jgi:hypothetical protein
VTTLSGTIPRARGDFPKKPSRDVPAVPVFHSFSKQGFRCPLAPTARDAGTSQLQNDPASTDFGIENAVIQLRQGAERDQYP